MAAVIILFLVISTSTTLLDQGNAQYIETNKCIIQQLTAECKSELTEIKDTLQSVPKNVTKLSIVFFNPWSGSFPKASNKVNITPICRLVNLESLEMTTDNSIVYDIDLIYENYTFAEMRKLRNLVINIPLNTHSLRNIVNYTPLLEELDLTDTHHLGLKRLSTMMREINITSLKVVKISNFQTIGTLGYSSVLNITKLFRGEVAQKVTQLDMSNNGIGFLTPSYIKTLPNLKYLDVSYNILIEFSNVIFVVDVALHPVLEVLNMSNQGNFRKENYVTEKQGNTLTNYTNQGYRLSSNITAAAALVFCININDYRNISNIFYNNTLFCEIIFCVLGFSLEKSAIQIAREIPCSALGNLADIFDLSCMFGFKLPAFQSAKVVSFNNLNFILTGAYIFKGNLCSNPSPLQEIGFSNNRQWIKGFRFSDTINNVQFSGPNSVQCVDLSENGAKLHIPINQRNIGTTVRKINLAGNQVVINSTEAICLYWPLMTFISLARNNISIIPQKLFNTCSNLKHIDLSSNILTEKTIALDFPVNSSLQFLNLSHNHIQLLPDPFVQRLENIHHNLNESLTLDITNNPLVCNCSQDAIRFVHWLHSTTINLAQRDNLICSSKNGLTLIQNIDVKNMRTECYPSNTVTIVTSVMSTITSIMVIFIGYVIHRYRWRIRKKIYDTQKWFSSRCVKSMNDNQLTSRQWQYDAFISYCSEDRFWVHDVLMRQLENEYGFKLCIHYRDFILGEAIADEIVRCIHLSKKLIIILSDVSITRPWCQFEMQVALREAVNRNTKIIIIKLQLQQLITDKTLVTLLETQVYLEWCEKVEGQKLFWAKLVDKLYGRDGDAACCCCCRSGMDAIETDDVIEVYDRDDEVNLIQ